MEQIHFRDHWSPEMSFVVGALLLFLIALVAWAATH